MTRLQGNSSSRVALILGTLIAAVLIGLTVWAVQRGQTASSVADGTVRTFALAGQPFLGKEGAPVNIVVFEDFKCPACKQFEDTALPTIQQKYIDTGKAKLYRLNFAFLGARFNLNPDDSLLAGQAAECAYDQTGNDGYNGLSTLLFRAQGPEDAVWASREKLVELAGSVEGLDPAKLGECVGAGTTKARVEADKQQANAAGVQGTPSIFVNGKVTSSFSADVVSKAIDDAVTTPSAAK